MKPPLDKQSWTAAASAYSERVLPWTTSWRERRKKREPHPVFDFLFTYYSFSAAKLESWSPGWRAVLEDPDNELAEIVSSAILSHCGITGTSRLNPADLPEKRVPMFRWIANLLETTAERPAQFGCFGLHEWAMVYRGHEVRHESITPLRLPRDEIDALVNSRPLCCTHFDAFRFFAPEARPLNRSQPTFDDRQDNEQAGCIHTNMDLYKWAYKSMPWIGSDLVWECFQFATACREIDMRASPYDLSAFGYEPIKIETTEGRREYETIQRELAERGKPLRQKLAEELRALLAAAEVSVH